MIDFSKLAIVGYDYDVTVDNNKYLTNANALRKYYNSRNY